MARKTIIVCDVTGEEGAETVEFAWDGTRYTIDLAEGERRKIEEFLSPYLEAAEEVAPGHRPLPVQPTGPDPAAVRKWAQENGIEVDGRGISEKGRIPAAFVDLYEKAQRESAES
ncbi:histone-like nucleoid-structuring protein Lsr2 [Peterkaempfera bronchialis]|nr:Lsr2 family protein [Peterkaempfera bronchialis]